MNILSIDLNPFGQRATLLSPDGELLGHYVAPPRAPVAEWLRKVVRGQVLVVGSPLDEWPDGAAELIESAGCRLQWLSPNLIRRLYSVCRPWNLHRKLHRAHFLGHLFVSGATPWTAEKVTQDFEVKAARAILEQVGLLL